MMLPVMSFGKASRCSHSELCVDCSPHAASAGFTRANSPKRATAASRPGRFSRSAEYAIPKLVFDDPSSFPAPLVLPGDDLALDPKYPPQSLKAWMTLKRTEPEGDDSLRNVIYLVPPPQVSDEAHKLLFRTTHANVPKRHAAPYLSKAVSAPSATEVREYLAAFYYPMDVKLYDGKCQWTPWIETTKTKGATNRIALQLTSAVGFVEEVGVRYRASLDGVAAKQLNLKDILDALMGALPVDTFAILMLADHDLYEDEDDEFCCGRAYGGSRVAVVSSFRYQPRLDGYEEIDNDHLWPSSHCRRYVNNLCAGMEQSAQSVRHADRYVRSCNSSSPLGAALQAFTGTLQPRTRRDLESLWFSRVARTASHELGHCFLLDHCVYYACVMQGTASIAEDVRQPPYLCPVCLQKVAMTMTAHVERGDMLTQQKTWARHRYDALGHVCWRWKDVGMFAAFGAWIEKHLESGTGSGQA